MFIGEAKSLGADLDAAHRQALDYLAGGSIGDHEFPKYVIVTDFARLRIDRLGAHPWTVELGIGEISLTTSMNCCSSPDTRSSVAMRKKTPLSRPRASWLGCMRPWWAMTPMKPSLMTPLQSGACQTHLQAPQSDRPP